MCVVCETKAFLCSPVSVWCYNLGTTLDIGVGKGERETKEAVHLIDSVSGERELPTPFTLF